MDQVAALEHLLATAPRRIAELGAALETMAEENADLRRQLAKNSDNSGNPPSRDGLIRLVPRSLRLKSGMLGGGQVAHLSNTLYLTPTPDFLERLNSKAGSSRLRLLTDEGRYQVFGTSPIDVRKHLRCI